MKIFISYSREDIETAEDLYSVLSGEGYKVFFDKSRRDGISDGEAFDKKIRQKIWGCHLFIFLVSSSSLKSGYARAELNIAIDKFAKFSSYDCRILPVQIQETVELPKNLRLNVYKPEGDVIPEISHRIALCKRKRSRKFLRLSFILVFLCLMASAVAGYYFFKNSSISKCQQLMTSEVANEASNFFRKKAREMGYSDIEVVDSWCGDFMISHWLNKSNLTNFLKQKTATSESGDFLIGIWQPTSISKEHSWNVGATITEPDVYGSWRNTLVRSSGIEPRESEQFNNDRGLSIVGGALVVGTYTDSFDKETSRWICSNFPSPNPVLQDFRPQNENLEWHVINGEPGCPQDKFLATKGTTYSDVELQRQLLNLSRLPNTSNIQTSDTVFISINQNITPGGADALSERFSVRVMLLWAKNSK